MPDMDFNTSGAGTSGNAKPTGKPATTTAAARDICEKTDLNPVDGGSWECGGSVCEAKCAIPGFKPQCTESAKITCLQGHGWNFKNTVCTCKIAQKRCDTLSVIKGSAIRKGVEMKCSAHDQAKGFI